MKNGNFISSFNYAVQGIISTLKTERNMKFHYLTALAVILLSLFFDLSKSEFMQMIFAIVFVVSAEMFNTAIERTVDLVVQEYNPIAKYIKDVAAGAVLLAAINAVVCGYLIFYNRIMPLGEIVIKRIKNSNDHLAFVAILVVLILTVGGKYIRAKKNGGTYFQGGAVSGHASLAFCCATIISLISENALVMLLSFIIAFLVAESRIEGKIHKLSEVITGAVLGVCVAILIFKIIG